MIIIALSSGVDYLQYDDNYAIRVEQKRQMKLTKYEIFVELWKQSKLQFLANKLVKILNLF